MGAHILIAIATIGIAGAILSVGASAGDSRPSFDCDKAAFADERAICSDSRLAEMDRLGSSAMHMTDKKMIGYLRDYLTADLKDRHACGGNKICIVDNQARVIELLGSNGAGVKLPHWLGSYRRRLVARAGVEIVRGLPKRIGTCARTKISSLLGSSSPEVAQGGSSVAYANGGYGTSYEYEPDSAIGDLILMCLASIPRNCPPGDARGREYAATNLRTESTWVLPDARHRCGGA